MERAWHVCGSGKNQGGSSIEGRADGGVGDAECGLIRRMMRRS